MGAVKNDRIARFLEMTSPERADATMEEMLLRMLGNGGANGGPESYIDVCRAWDIPSGKFLLWVRQDVGRYRAFNDALEMQARVGAAEVRGIVDEEPRTTEKGTIDPGDIAWKKIRMDGRKWLARVHAPETFIERTEVKVDVRVDLASRLMLARERVLDGESRVVGETLPAIRGEGAVL